MIKKTKIKIWILLCLLTMPVYSAADVLSVNFSQYLGNNPNGVVVNDFLSISPIFVESVIGTDGLSHIAVYHGNPGIFTFDTDKVEIQNVEVRGESNNSSIIVTALGELSDVTLQSDKPWLTPVQIIGVSEPANLGIGNISTVEVGNSESHITDFIVTYTRKVIVLDESVWRSGCHTILEGDYNGDGITDYYLQATPVGQLVALPYNIDVNVSTSCEVGDVVLQARADGSYTIIYPPDSTKLSATTWLNTTKTLAYEDFNNDGVQDLIIQAQNINETSIIVSAIAGSKVPSSVQTIARTDAGAGGVVTKYSRTSLDTAAGNNYSKTDNIYTGVLSGSFAVTNNGKPNYNIPLELPPSVQNVAPNLSLSYNGGSGNDIFGVGWHLEGLSKITRCSPTLAQDGYINAVNFNSSDKFCLNGQRLIVVNGTYGANSAEYRTENESITKIMSFGSIGSGPQSFTVWRRNGHIERYGNTANSRRVSQTGLGIVEWGINEKTDNRSGRVNYAYVNNTVSGNFYISNISFNGNIVNFNYESRTDITPSYANGALSVLPVRVNNITTSVSGGQVRKYNIIYGSGAATSRSRITHIQECLVDGCKPATVFEWDLGNETVAFTKQSTETDSYTAGAVYENQQYHMADVSGDGRSDLVWTYRNNNDLGRVVYTANANGVGFTQQSSEIENGFAASIIADSDQKYITGDVNGDGKSDLVWVGRLNADVYRVIYLANSTGSGFVSQGYEVDTNNQYSLHNKGQYQLADVNGDGRSDLVWSFVFADKLGQVVYLSHTDTVGRISLEKTSFNIDDDYTPDFYDNHFFQTGDVNGDGKSDLIWTFTYLDNLVRVLYLANSNGTAFTKISLQKDRDIFSSTIPYRDQKFHLGDVNADGKADLVWTYNYNNKLGRNVYLTTSKGTSFNRKTQSLDAATASFIPNNHTFPQTGLVDLNGDGKLDLVYTYNHGTAFGYRTYLANMNGEGFSAGPENTINDANSSLQNQHYLLGDINADGKTDLVWAYSTSTNGLGRVSYTLPASHPDHIVGITDGFGQKTSIRYRYLADNSTGFYTKGSTAEYPLRDDHGLSYLVEHVEESNGIGGIDQYDYTYEGAQTDLHGRGFLGFKKRTVIDRQTGFLTTETYRQDFPFTGVAESVVVTQPNGRAVEKVFNHWKQNTITHAGGRDSVLRYLKDTVAIKYDLAGGSVLAQLTIDDYNLTDGTLKKRITATGKSFNGAIDASYNLAGNYLTTDITGIDSTHTVDYIYNNNISQWIIGFVSQKTDTFEVPGQLPQTVVSNFVRQYSNSHLIFSEEQFSGTNQWIKNTYTRDNAGNVRSLTVTGADIDGSTITPRVTTWGIYTNNLYPTHIENDLGHRTVFKYNERVGKVSQEINVNKQVSDFIYDDFGRLVYQKAADGTDTRIILKPCTVACPNNGKYSLTTSNTHQLQVGQGSPQTIQYFDALNRELRTDKTGFDGRVIRIDTEYDSRGRVDKTSQPYYVGGSKYWTNYSYDVFNRVILELQAGGGQIVSRYSVDPIYATRTTTTQTVVVPGAANKNIVTIAKNNSIDQLIESIDAHNTVTVYAYNPRGALSEVTVNGNTASTISIVTDLAGNKTRMDDPDAGTLTYEYNGAGELRRLIQDPTGIAHTTTTSYDTLGRVTSKTDNDGANALISSWDYDQGRNAKGLLVSTSNADYEKTIQYDALSRIASTTTTLFAETAPKVFRFAYDSFSRQMSEEYPSGLILRTDYNSRGYVDSTSNAVTSQSYWQVVDADAYGNVTEEQYGNGITTIRAYNPATNKLNSLNTGTSQAQSGIQNLGFQFDTTGSLVQRINNTLVEDFIYDNLLRVKSSVTKGLASGSRNINYDYDALGNITSKSDVSDINGYHYAENGAGVHAVSRVVKGTTTTNYGYDVKGNMISRGNNTIDYTVFNKPSLISKPNVTTSFRYNPDRVKYYRNSTENGNTTEHFYYGAGTFEVVKQGSSVREKTYIGDYLVYNAVRQAGSLGSGSDVRYLHRDHIGSVEAITDSSGAQITRMAFGPFGGRRQDNWENSDAAFTAGLTAVTFNTTDRGFTNHEHIDDFDLIHMKGRMYDPVIGRFISPDEFVQLPEFSQSYNRYSYVLNNPLTFRDESGEFIVLIWHIGRVAVQAAIKVAIRQAPKAGKALDKVSDVVDRVEMAEDIVSGNLDPVDTLSMGPRKFKNKGSGGGLPIVSKKKSPKAGNKSNEASSPEKSKGVDENTELGEKNNKESNVTKSAADRASEIHKAVPEATQRRTTIAVTETQEGVRVISSSEKRLRPAQRKLLGKNEVEGVGLGHAEVTGVNHARGADLKPTGTAASRPICSGCQGFLKEQNVKPLSPPKK